jgi:hypothetical protein
VQASVLLGRPDDDTLHLAEIPRDVTVFVKKK